MRPLMGTVLVVARHLSVGRWPPRTTPSLPAARPTSQCRSHRRIGRQHCQQPAELVRIPGQNEHRHTRRYGSPSLPCRPGARGDCFGGGPRSEEHTSELHSLPVPPPFRPAGGPLAHLHPYRPPDQLPTAEAIVVLGGSTANNRLNWFESLDKTNTVTRVDTAARLYHAGRAPVVIVSGAA